MRTWTVVAICLAVGAGSAGAEPVVRLNQRADVSAVVVRWLDAQNSGDFAAYSKLYSPGFRGVRMSGGQRAELDVKAWLADRARMFEQPMKVAIEGAVVRDESAATATVWFVQRWSSGKYRDVGRKFLRIDRGKGTIDEEELLESVTGSVPSGLVELSTPDDGPLGDMISKVRDSVPPMFPTLLELADGLPDTADDRHVIGVCDLEQALPVIAALRPVISVQVRKARSRGKTGCPRPGQADPDEPGSWDWPRVAQHTRGDRRISLLAWPYRGQQLGDFAREFEYQVYVALLRDGKGKLLDILVEDSGSNYAQLQSISATARGATATESFIDAPCDGTDDHRYKQIERTLRFEIVGDTLRATTRDRTIGRDKCSDEEMRYYDNP